jgi:phosphohistidine phosphatase
MIWLLRHGEASGGSPDAERPLTELGRDQARTAGVALAAIGVELDACLASPLVRARQTAELACEPLGVEVQIEEALSGGAFDATGLAAGMGEQVLLVGHDPDFSDAVRGLTGARVHMKKGAVAGTRDGELKVLLRPRELAAIASG